MLAPTNMLPRAPLYRWLSIALLFAIGFLLLPNFKRASLSAYNRASSSDRTDLDQTSWVKQILRNNSIGPDITYAARTLQYLPVAKERLSVTEMEHNLFPDKFADIKIDAATPLPAGKTVGVRVKQLSRPEDADASGLIFGVSTTLQRFNDDNLGPIKEFTRWLTDGKGNTNGAGLVVALVDCTEADLDKAWQRMANVGINATVVAANPGLDMPGRYVDLVRMLWQHPTASQRKYFALIDDDTFFPAMSELVRELSQYDYNKPYYIGTFSERIDWMISNQVPMAYGGGGVFLTAPVAKQIVEANCLEKREDGGYVLDATQGDRLLYNCLHNKTEVKLTYNPKIYQVDLFGDTSGFYENGHQLLSLHHYKSWHRNEVAKVHLVADACGEDCVLQRFKFKDNFIISNGYSVAEYPRGIDFDLDQTECTFDVPDILLAYRFGELRKSLSHTGRKNQWQIFDTRKERDGKVTQVYLKQRTDDRWVQSEEVRPARDSVIVLTWIP